MPGIHKIVTCPICGETTRADNMARHNKRRHDSGLEAPVPPTYSGSEAPGLTVFTGHLLTHLESLIAMKGTVPDHILLAAAVYIEQAQKMAEEIIVVPNTRKITRRKHP